MREVQTGIEIDASPAHVWNVLLDFAKYPLWNPFLRSVTGEAAIGKQLEVRMRLPSAFELTLRPTVMNVEREYELRWQGKLGIPGLLDAEHIFEIYALESGKCIFVQRERFSGLLVPLLWRRLEEDVTKSFTWMNSTLKMVSEYLEHQTRSA